MNHISWGTIGETGSVRVHPIKREHGEQGLGQMIDRFGLFGDGDHAGVAQSSQLIGKGLNVIEAVGRAVAVIREEDIHRRRSDLSLGERLDQFENRFCSPIPTEIGGAE